MKKLGTIFVFLIITSLVLAACQPKEEAPVSQPESENEIVVENPADG